MVPSLSGARRRGCENGIFSRKEFMEYMPRKKNDLTEKLTSLSDATMDAAKEAAETMGDAAKAVAKMAEPTVKKVRRKAEPTVKKAGEAIKETSRKATAALVPEVFVQWNGREAGCAELVDRAKADYKAQHKGAIRSCKLYVKPEDGTVYYVINGKSGQVSL